MREKDVELEIEEARVPLGEAKPATADAPAHLPLGSNTDQAASIGAQEHGFEETLAASSNGDSALDATAVAPNPKAQDFTSLSKVDDSNYVLGRELARGGMGRIVQARDRRLGRAVAIKELLRPSPAAEQRFEREMKITARLQHPAIIGVLEAGRWSSGNAFYTMKHIDGRPLDSVIESQKSFADRLALLPRIIAVVDALAYAHARRVIHRDLKPANVLVGSYGETIVIDWGLAKDLNQTPASDEELNVELEDGNEQLTILGRAMGTPAYMPPEQARGTEVDERADVYSLGALLYHLLSGQMPYTGAKSAREILRRVLKESPRPLEELCSGIPPDLLSIINKAMERDADARYSSAQELAEDLRRFEAGQRVSVHDYSPRTIVVRWIARHRTAVISSLFLVTLLMAFAAWSFRSHALERDAVALQRDRAESNRVESEGLVTFMVRTMFEELEPIGQVTLLKLVAEEADSYYEKRDIDWSRPTDIQNRAASLEILARVSEALGNLDEATTMQRAALALRQRLSDQDPTELLWLANLSRGHLSLGKLLDTNGEYTESVHSYEVALALTGAIEQKEPSNLAILGQKRSIHELLGKTHFSLNAYAEALVHFELALQIGQRLADGNPGDLEQQESLAIGHEDLSSFFVHVERLDEAQQHALSSLEIREEMARQKPENTQFKRDLSVSHNDLGDVFLAKRNVSEALEQFQASLGIGTRLSDSDPLNMSWKRDLALNHYKMGSVLASAGNSESALEHYDKALVLFEELTEKDPANYRWKSDLATMNTMVGSFLLQQDADAARIYFGRAAQLFTTFAKAPADVYNAGGCFALIGDADQAFVWLEKAVDTGGFTKSDFKSDESLISLIDDPRWGPLLERIGEQVPTD